MAENMESEVASFRILIMAGTDPALEPYRALIFSRFLHSVRSGNNWFRKIDSHAFYPAYHKLLEQMLSRQGCVVRVAVLTDDPDVAVGWSIARPNILDYVFVKRDGRRQGIGRALLPEQFAVVTHLTSLGELYRDRHFPSVRFDPFK